VPINPKQVINIPSNINPGLSAAKQSTMLQILGMPRDTFDQTCRPITNRPLKNHIVTENVGPFRVTGFRPAVESLREVLDKVKSRHPEVHDMLGTVGMACALFVRGSSSRISNHSWGCAIDIDIDGALDGIGVEGGTGRRDNKTLAGLAAMAPFFNEAGWFWGVGFSSFEDGMHFEIADETIRTWHADGKLGPDFANRTPTDPVLSIGDEGPEVRKLQETLAKLGFDIIPDGIFGPITHGIVIEFQATNGLVADGRVGPKTKAALGL